MKTHFLSLLLFAIILASSCSQEEIVQQQTVSLSDCKFVASFEQNESRTYLEDGKYLRWTANDEVSIFMGKTLNRQFRFTGETGDNSGGFEEASSPGFVTGNDLDNPCHYAIYPYDKGTKITETGVLTVNLPSEQTYAENSFGCGANTMVAVTSGLSDMELSFKNACGYLRFKLYGDDVTVKSVTLQSNGEEKLSGSATLMAANNKNPSITMSSTASNMITLDCGTGVKIGSTSETATAFWFVVPPTTFESGFTVTIKDVNSNEFVKSTSKKISIERNVIKPISAFKVSTAVPNNQIWYTSSDGNVVAPYVTGAWDIKNTFGANIESNVYENGKGTITFDGDVTDINNYAFWGCSSLTSITIPNSVPRINSSAFSGCTSLTNITIPNSVKKIGGAAFSGCTSLTNITIPNGVAKIEYSAFQDCSSLTSIVIPNSVTEIGKGAFARCGSLSNIVVEEGNTVYDSRDNCNAIIETTSNKLIQGCKNTIISNSVTIIGQLAFSGCTFLSSITIPSNVTSIEEAPFQGCTSLSSIVVENGNFVYDSRDNCNAIVETASNTLIQGCKNTVIPNSVTNIGSSAFAACTFSNITIPNNVTNIGDWAFANCSSLISITIPNSVISIGYATFEGCKFLTSITIPNSVTEIGEYAFVDCSSLKDVYVKAINPPTIYGYTFEFDFINYYVPAGSLEAYKAADYWKDLNLIETIPTYHVTTAGTLSTLISEEDKYTITEMKVTGYLNGDDIRFIRAMAGRAYSFFNTTNGKLISLDLSEANIVEGGGAYCMENYTNSNTNGAYTSNNVIGAYMFKMCNFQKLLLPNNIISIEYAGVERCFDLKEVNIPSGLISIGDYAFNETSIEYIVLPESLQKLGSYSFDLCPLKEIHCKSKLPLPANSFVGHTSYDNYKLVTSTCKLYVPKESLSAYQSANYWKGFSSIIEE